MPWNTNTKYRQFADKWKQNAEEFDFYRHQRSNPPPEVIHIDEYQEEDDDQELLNDFGPTSSIEDKEEVEMKGMALLKYEKRLRDSRENSVEQAHSRS